MRSALTRLEVLVIVVVAILAIGLLIPLVQWQRTAARSTMCQDRQRRLAEAAHAFDRNDGVLPGYRNVVGSDRITGWVTVLLPMLSSPDDKSPRGFQEAYDAIVASKTGPTRFPELLCPGVAEYKREAPLAFVANCGMPDVNDDQSLPPDWPANGVFFDRTEIESLHVEMSLDWLTKHDGTRVTLLFSENVDATSWVAPNEAETGFLWAANMEDGNPTPHPTLLHINERRGEWENSEKFARPSSEHPGGVNVAMASGQTQFLNDKIDYLAFQLMMTSDGENVKTPNKDEPLKEPWRYNGK